MLKEEKDIKLQVWKCKRQNKHDRLIMSLLFGYAVLFRLATDFSVLN